MRSVASLAVAVSAVAVSVGGCASVAADASRYDSDVDIQRVSAVDRAAKSRNVEVRWIRYPTRKAAPAVAPAPDGTTGS